MTYREENDKKAKNPYAIKRVNNTPKGRPEFLSPHTSIHVHPAYSISLMPLLGSHDGSEASRLDGLTNIS